MNSNNATREKFPSINQKFERQKQWSEWNRSCLEAQKCVKRIERIEILWALIRLSFPHLSSVKCGRRIKDKKDLKIFSWLNQIDWKPRRKIQRMIISQANINHVKLFFRFLSVLKAKSRMFHKIVGNAVEPFVFLSFGSRRSRKANNKANLARRKMKREKKKAKNQNFMKTIYVLARVFDVVKSGKRFFSSRKQQQQQTKRTKRCLRSNKPRTKDAV